MRRSIVLVAPFVALFAVVAGSSCSAGSSSGGGFGGDDNSSPSSVTGTASNNPQTTTFVGPSTGQGGNNGCGTSCSADLKSVMDCNGNVVMTCPNGQGCGKNGCEDPCQAAVDNQSTIGCDFYS